MYDASFVKNLLGSSMSLLLIVVISFFLSNILNFKDNIKNKFLRVFVILLFFYLLTKINKYTYEYRSFIIMIGYIVTIFTVSKDKISKKIIIFLETFIPNILLNPLITYLAGFKNGFTIHEIEEMIKTTEGFYKYNDIISQGYSYFVLNGIFDIFYTFIMIIILLIHNKNQDKKAEIFLISFLITFFACFSGVLSYLYLGDIISMIILLVISIGSVFIMIYSYNKLKFYKEYQEQKLEIKYLKEKEKLEYLHYKELLEKEEKIHKIRHDLKNDLQSINLLNDAKQKNKLVRDLNKKIDNASIIKYSNNNLLNMLLNIKKEEAKNQKIEFKINMEIMSFNLDEIDLINLFSNIIDNALHATNKKINLTVKNNMNNLYVYCENDISNNIIHGSGYGLKIIKDIVNKYDGTLKINSNDKFYKIEILIPNE